MLHVVQALSSGWHRGLQKAGAPLDPVSSDVDTYVVDAAAFEGLAGLHPGLMDKGRIFVEPAARALLGNAVAAELAAVRP